MTGEMHREVSKLSRTSLRNQEFVNSDSHQQHQQHNDIINRHGNLFQPALSSTAICPQIPSLASFLNASTSPQNHYPNPFELSPTQGHIEAHPIDLSSDSALLGSPLFSGPRMLQSENPGHGLHSLSSQHRHSIDSSCQLNTTWANHRSQLKHDVRGATTARVPQQLDNHHLHGRSAFFALPNTPLVYPNKNYSHNNASNQCDSTFLPLNCFKDSQLNFSNSDVGLFFPHSATPSWPMSVSLHSRQNNRNTYYYNDHPNNRKWIHRLDDRHLSSMPKESQRITNVLPFPPEPSLDRMSPERLGWTNEHNAALSVFVGNIPKNTAPDVFNRLMSTKGTITEIVCDFRPECWLTAFVTYSKPSEAIKAVEFFNNRRAIKTAPPHRLVCCFAPHPPASLCCSTPTISLLQEVKPGTAPVLPFFPKFGQDPGDPASFRRGSSIPRFSLLKDGPPGANLFIYGIPSDWTEVTLMRLCQEFGHIVGIRVPGATRPQRLNKGFGFVSYDSIDSSARALEALGGRQFLGKPLNVQLKLGEQLAGYSASATLESSNWQSPQQLHTQQGFETEKCNLKALSKSFNQNSDITSKNNNRPIVQNISKMDFGQPSPPQLNSTQQIETYPSFNDFAERASSSTRWTQFLPHPNLLPSVTGLSSLSKTSTTSQPYTGMSSPNGRASPDNSDEETPSTTATSTPKRTTSLKPSSGESNVSSMLLSENDFTLSAVSQQGTTVADDEVGTPFNFDSPRLLNSVLGFLTAQPDGRFSSDRFGSTINQGALEELSSDPLPPLIGEVSNPNLQDLDSSLCKLLERHWQKDVAPDDQLNETMRNSINRLNSTVSEFEPRNAIPSHEDLKSLFSHWTRSSFSRSIVNLNLNEKQCKPPVQRDGENNVWRPFGPIDDSTQYPHAMTTLLSASSEYNNPLTQSNLGL